MLDDAGVVIQPLPPSPQPLGIAAVVSPAKRIIEGAGGCAPELCAELIAADLRVVGEGPVPSRRGPHDASGVVRRRPTPAARTSVRGREGTGPWEGTGPSPTTEAATGGAAAGLRYKTPTRAQRRRSAVDAQPIADAGLGHQQLGTGRVVFQLAPEVVDVDPELLGVLGGVAAPDPFQQLPVGQDFVQVGRQDAEQLVL